MSQEKFDNEKEIRRFLLGEMSDAERAAFETQFIAEDAGLVERINVVEDELIEAYIRETLSTGEKAKFEQHFPTTETRRRRDAFAREMFAQLAARREDADRETKAAAVKTPVWDSIINLFKTPRFAFGVGFAILLLAFGAWLLVFRNPEKRVEIVQQTTPPPIVRETPPEPPNNQNGLRNSNVNPANSAPVNKLAANANAENTNKNQPPNEVLKPVVATLALFAGTVRAEGKTSELNLTKDTTGARLQLNLESRDYRIYRAEIVDPDGKVIYQSGRLIARGSRIDTFFPTAKLKKGDYLVKLYGLNSSGADESAADFQFRVTQK